MSPGTMFAYQPGGGLKVEHASLKSLIKSAYDLRDFQLSGVSGWMETERYVILAKGQFDGPSEYRKMNDEQRKGMSALVSKRLQNLLAERFHLVIHRETKELPVYALVVAKGGVKMAANTSPDGSPQSMTTGRAMFKATRASLQSIAASLASITGRPVRDETGLTGFYDLDVKWTPDAPVNPDSEKPPEVGPTIFTALQEQLGLKLESRKGPVEIVVVDSAERPSEN